MHLGGVAEAVLGPVDVRVGRHHAADVVVLDGGHVLAQGQAVLRLVVIEAVEAEPWS